MVTVNARTRAMVTEAERLAGFTFHITQGKNPGKNADPQSAGTHDGDGVIDVGAEALTPQQRQTVVWALRTVGFAAWLRNPSQAHPPWPWHVHAVALGEPNLSPAAARQVTAYLTGHNGLANNGPDDGPRDPNPKDGWYVGITWEIHQQQEEKDVTPEQATKMLALLTSIDGTLRGMNDRIGYIANDGMKDVDTIRDVLKPGVDG